MQLEKTLAQVSHELSKMPYASWLLVLIVATICMGILLGMFSRSRLVTEHGGLFYPLIFATYVGGVGLSVRCMLDNHEWGWSLGAPGIFLTSVFCFGASLAVSKDIIWEEGKFHIKSKSLLYKVIYSYAELNSHSRQSLCAISWKVIGMLLIVWPFVRTLQLLQASVLTLWFSVVLGRSPLLVIRYVFGDDCTPKSKVELLWGWFPTSPVFWGIMAWAAQVSYRGLIEQGWWQFAIGAMGAIGVVTFVVFLWLIVTNATREGYIRSLLEDEGNKNPTAEQIVSREEKWKKERQKRYRQSWEAISMLFGALKGTVCPEFVADDK